MDSQVPGIHNFLPSKIWLKFKWPQQQFASWSSWILLWFLMFFRFVSDVLFVFRIVAFLFVFVCVLFWFQSHLQNDWTDPRKRNRFSSAPKNCQNLIPKSIQIYYRKIAGPFLAKTCKNKWSNTPLTSQPAKLPEWQESKIKYCALNAIQFRKSLSFYPAKRYYNMLQVQTALSTDDRGTVAGLP